MTRSNKRPLINSLGKAIGKTERPHDRNDFVFSDDPAKWGVFGSSEKRKKESKQEWERQKKRKAEGESKRSGKTDFHRKHG